MRLHRSLIIVALTLAAFLAGARGVAQLPPAAAQSQPDESAGDSPPGGTEQAGTEQEQPPAEPAPSFNDSRDQVRVTAVPALRKVAPGSRVLVAVIFDHNDGWHVQANQARDPDVIRTTIRAQSADARLKPHADYIQWPPFKLGKFGGGIVESEVFEGMAVAVLPVTVPETATPGPAKLELFVTYQACNARVCLAPATDQQLTVNLQIVAPDQAETTAHINPALFGNFPLDRWDAIARGQPLDRPIVFDVFGWHFQIRAAGALGLALLLLVAALGGLILNFTPCVLPVIPIKIMSLSMGAGHRGRTLLLGSIMALGIIAFWLGMGIAIATVSGFTATNQLFQYPAFTISVGLIIAVMAVGMCGVFAIQLPQSIATLSPRQDTVVGSFLFGIMTAVLSTPCTGPFMGAAAAWAATQPPRLTLLTFTAIGFGMALPYLVLAAFPALVKKMPRTGPASELIKQVMGLLMLAAAAFFIGTGLSGLLAAPPTPPSRLYWWVVAAFGVMAGLWLAWRTVRITTRAGRRIVFGGLGLVIAAISLAVGLFFTDKGPIDWVYYTPQRFADATKAGNVVVMEFTAEWCLNCKALEQSVLRDPRVVQLLKDRGVVPIKVDLTGNNVDGNQMLKQVNRLTIPLLVIFAPDGSTTFTGDFYTPQQVIDAVRAARGGQFATSSP